MNANELAQQFDALLATGRGIYAPRLYREQMAMIAAALRQTSAVQSVITKFEDGENHDDGAFDADCEVCRILKELRTLVRTSAQQGPATNGR